MTASPFTFYFMSSPRLDSPGSSVNNQTGSWRTGQKPVHLKQNCINCLFCFNFCPDQCWQAEDAKISEVDLTYCKGCGVCATVCPAPRKAIEMRDENAD